MKGEEPLLDRAGVYTQLQQLLSTESSNNILELLPPDTRAVWQSLGAAAAAEAAKRAKAGDTPEVQQEMALQRMQQLLEAAADGQPVKIERKGGDENTPLMLNGIIPQILAHKPFAEERDFQGEFNPKYISQFCITCPFRAVQYLLFLHCDSCFL